MSTSQPPHQQTATTEPRRTIVITLPSGWARTTLAGIEAAFLGWAIPALIAVIMLWAVAENPWMKEVSWQSAALVGTDFWALSLGGKIQLGGVTVSLIPTLWTAAQVVVVRALLLSSKNYSPVSLWMAVPSFLVTSVILAAATAPTASPMAVIPAAVVVPFLGVVWAVIQQTGSQPSWYRRLPWIGWGLRVGGWWFAVAIILGCITLAVAAWQGRAAMAESTAVFGDSRVDNGLLALVQILYLPSLAAWALAWLSGGGIRLDDAAVLSPTRMPETVLPPLPVTGLLPQTVVGIEVIWVVVAAGLLAGVLTGLRLRKESFPEVSQIVAVAVVSSFLWICLWMLVSSGGLGEQRLASLGPNLLLSLIALGTRLLLVAATVTLLLQPFTWQVLREGVGFCTHQLSKVPSIVKHEQRRLRKSREARVGKPSSVSAAESLLSAGKPHSVQVSQSVEKPPAKTSTDPIRKASASLRSFGRLDYLEERSENDTSGRGSNV